MKWRVLLSTFVPVLAVIFLLVYAVSANLDSFKLFVAILIAVVTIGRVVLSDTKYLVSFNLVNGGLELQYYTSLLKLKSLHIPESGTSDIRLIRPWWAFGSAADLVIKSNEESLIFVIGTKKQLQQLEVDLSRIRAATA